MDIFNRQNELQGVEQFTKADARITFAEKEQGCRRRLVTPLYESKGRRLKQGQSI